jgi:uncharacterized membrane protein
MTSNRLEAFSDGVLAIVITIMVLELKVPHATDASALRPLVPVFLSYVLSFIYLGIYWNNHHHLFQAVRQVHGAALWANLHLLFWLSLVPFVTGWMGENHLARLPVALYGIVLLGAAMAYSILTRTLLAHHGRESTLARAIGRDRKGKVSLLLYLLAIPLVILSVWLSIALYAATALLWLVPDSRVEKTLAQGDPTRGG